MNIEQLELKARTAKARAEIVKYSFEEIMYSLKLDQLKNPEKYGSENIKAAEGEQPLQDTQDTSN